MFSNVIYEKSFSKDPIQEALQKQQSADIFNNEQAKYTSFHDMLLSRELQTIYIRRPYKMEKRKKFINAAIAFSDLHQIDLTIHQSKGLISATFCFNACAGVRNLGKLMGMADEFEFLTNIHGHDLCMTLHYYTHSIIRNGITISPD